MEGLLVVASSLGREAFCCSPIPTQSQRCLLFHQPSASSLFRLDPASGLFFCLFILHTAALRPWHIYNGLQPPGRDQLVMPPRSPPIRTKKHKERENCSPGLDSAPLPWDRRLSTPVPALPALSKPPSPTLHPSPSCQWSLVNVGHVRCTSDRR
jgi:hypothetical protein